MDTEESGDLGLGRGLKPGAICDVTVTAASNSTDLESEIVPPPRANARFPVKNTGIDHIDVTGVNVDPQSFTKSDRLLLKWIGRKKTHPPGVHTETDAHSESARTGSTSSDNQTHEQGINGKGGDESFPIYADVVLGTSLRQQRKLFNEQLHALFPMSQTMDEAPRKDLDESSKKFPMLSYETLQKKLLQTQKEVKELNEDLELAREHLDVKFKALKVLQNQLFAVQKQQYESTNKTKDMQGQLQREINAMQFEMEHQESVLMNSQEMWSERFDRVSRENKTLTDAMEKQSDEMKRLFAEKACLKRERDELLALMDVQDRQKYTSRHSSSTDDDYNNFSSSELAVLGACRCRKHNPDPCGCAHAAAFMKREITRLREEMETVNQSKNETEVLVNVYCTAFEEQLSRHRSIMQQLSKLAAPSPEDVSRKGKMKAVLKWLIQQLNEDEAILNPIRMKRLQNSESSRLDEMISNSKHKSQNTATDSLSLLSLFDNNTATLPITTQCTTMLPTSMSTSSLPPTLQIPNNLCDKPQRSNSAPSSPSTSRTNISQTSSMAFNSGSNLPRKPKHLRVRESFSGCSVLSASTHEGGDGDSSGSRVHEMLSKEFLSTLSEQELIGILVEMIVDQHEALAHQRITTRILAAKCKRLEMHLSNQNEEVFA